ncbi:MAG: class I SAM-dependent methyltransferase [Kamptonema sp. SIO4C4]|nr:class I SAM-dependent methyltransferase [Kamptonema sp. SIO4C4]
MSLPTHNYQQFSEQYSQLQIEKTYFLAFRAVAELLAGYEHQGKRVLDFGCGTGRSTRFLQNLGLAPVGVDINSSMLRQAQQFGGDYYLLESENLPFPRQSFEIIFQSFVLLEYASTADMEATFQEFHRVLTDNGIIVIVTGSEEYYRHDWLSFEMGKSAHSSLQSGCKVPVSIRDTEIVLFDYYWTDQDYRQVFQNSGFTVVKAQYPLAQGNEPFAWISECEFPCWTIYMLKKQS